MQLNLSYLFAISSSPLPSDPPLSECFSDTLELTPQFILSLKFEYTSKWKRSAFYRMFSVNRNSFLMSENPFSIIGNQSFIWEDSFHLKFFQFNLNENVSNSNKNISKSIGNRYGSDYVRYTHDFMLSNTS